MRSWLRNQGVDPCLIATDGEIAYSNQFRSGPTIQAYLWWRDRQDLFGDTFSEPQRPGPTIRAYFEAEKHRSASLPHLTLHDYFCGYFLPTSFGAPISLPEGGRVSSTHRALEEVKLLYEELSIPDDYQSKYDASDRLVGVKLALNHLRRVLQHSQEASLPAIFWG